MVRWLAGADGDAPALIEGDAAWSYAQLTERIAARRAELALPGRQLVVLAGERCVDYVVTYLALMTAGHVPILAAGHVDRVAAAWSPAAVVHADQRGWSIERRPATGDGWSSDLHADLALLLSTSGSTGSPKLVRLSHANLTANAASIAASLGLTADDRAITALPLHYCYGLSVLHSHLAVGGSVVIESASVVDPCFGVALSRHGVTNLAAVPYTLKLLEQADPDRIAVPTLRLLTHAGGRLDTELAERWLDRTERWGAEFVAMYGQTEATARMAYLPPELARRHPGTLGLAVPGGALSVEPVDELPAGVPAQAGEIVYRGPNVMMGYAERPADLARPAEVHELRTGDLGVVDPESGLVRIVGRRARFVKPFGVRVDLDVVEREVAASGLAGGHAAVGGDDTVLVVAAPGADAGRLRAHVAAFTGLPAHRIGTLSEIPRTSAGKVDYPELIARGRPSATTTGPSARTGGVAESIALVLGVERVSGDDTFVALGGDSLSYVEAAARLEPLVGRLPSDWHFRPISELEQLAVVRAAEPPRRRWVQWTDTTALLRAVGICTVVLTHMRWAYFPGGAHVMLAVVGYNVSRFVLPIEHPIERLRHGARTIGRVAAPTVAWVTAGMVLFGSYSAGTLLLVNNYVGPRGHRDDHWHFWFIEVFVHLVALMLLVSAVPAVRALDRRRPCVLPVGAIVLGVVLRQEWAQMDDWYNLRFRTHGVLVFFALGWLIDRSRTVRQRLLTTAIVCVAVADTFHLPQRELFIGTSLVLLLWSREVPLPRLLGAPVAALASASMWILITHFSTYPWLMERLPIAPAYAGTLALGVAAWIIAERSSGLTGLLARRRRDAPGANLLVPAGSVA